MKLGAQLFSVRSFIQNAPNFSETLAKIKKIGYENVQLSGGGPIAPEDLLKASQTYELPIVCTHSPFDRIIGDTDNLIREHKIFDSPVIGLGAMPRPYQGSAKGLEAFLDLLKEPVKKIEAAGLSFAYHNHHFEFQPLPDSDRIAFDIMLEACPDWHFIADTYWIAFASYSVTEYLEKIGGKRLVNIHYKDMANTEKREICACGDGVLNFSEITRVCEKLGVQNVLVEQDNAVDMPDPFGEMEKSFRHLRPIVK